MGSGWQLSNSGWSAVGGRAQRCRLPWRWRGAGRSMSPRASSFNKSVRMAMSLSRPASLRHCHSWAKCWESRCRDHCGRSIRSARMPSMSASVKCRPWTQIVLTQPIYPETPHRVQRQMSNLQAAVYDRRSHPPSHSLQGITSRHPARASRLQLIHVHVR